MSIGTSPFQGGGGASVADATETTAGKIRIATSTEASTGTNDTTAMTPLTVKERIDAALVGGVEYKGTFNATAGTPSLADAEKGDLYIIGTIGTIYGATWALGDHLLINADMGGSIDNAKIDKVDNTDAVTSVNGLSGPVVLNGGNVGADYSATNYIAASTNINGHLEGINDEFFLTATLASPALTGNPTAPTQSASDNSTKIATTFYVDRAVSAGGASDASETVKGIIEIATSAEATTGTDDLKAMTPLTVKERIDALSLGTASTQDVGTSASNVVQLDGSARLPAVDGSQLTNLPSASDASETTKGIIEIATSAEATTGTDDLKAMTPLTVKERIDALSLGTASTQDVGTSASNVVQLDGSARLPAVDGSQLTNLPTASAASETTAGIIEIATSAEATTGTDDLKAMTPLTVKERIDALSSTYQPLDAGLTSISGLTTAANKMIFTDGSNSYDTTDLTAFARSFLDDANATTARSTLSLGTASTEDVGTSANNVVQLDGSARLPAVDGSQLTNLPSASDASETTKGIIEIATSAEATTGTDDLKAMTPLTVKERIDALSSTYQPLAAGLTSIANLTTAADKMIFTDGSDSYAVTGLTAAGRAILDDADAAAQRTTLGAIAELSEDSSPQLGGNLDLAGSDIVTTSNADLDLAPHGTGVVSIRGNQTGGNNQGAIKLNCEQNSATHGVTLKAPAHGNGGYTLTLPNNDGDADQVLKTDGSGVLSWVAQSGGGGGNATLTQETLSGDKTISTPSASRTIFVFTSSADRVINLPAASDLSSGQLVDIKSMSNQTFTITPNGTDNLDGVSGGTLAMNVQYSSVTLVCDGTDDWFIV